MEATATAKHIRITPRKARQVIDLIRGKRVGDALSILTFTPLHAARIVKKLLDSAVANAEQKKVGDLDSLTVAKAYVNQGVTMKRMRARAMGRGNVIKKRTSHITVVLSKELGRAPARGHQEPQHCERAPDARWCIQGRDRARRTEGKDQYPYC